jgi:biotin carboxyl carrier protein
MTKSNKKVQDSELKTLNINSSIYKTRLTKKYENRQAYESPNERLIKSFIPGTIRDIFVKEGQKVNEGDPMLILEAMKMENRLYFPADGIIKKIHVNVGDRIPKGTLMVEYE